MRAAAGSRGFKMPLRHRSARLGIEHVRESLGSRAVHDQLVVLAIVRNALLLQRARASEVYGTARKALSCAAESERFESPRAVTTLLVPTSRPMRVAAALAIGAARLRLARALRARVIAIVHSTTLACLLAERDLDRAGILAAQLVHPELIRRRRSARSAVTDIERAFASRSSASFAAASPSQGPTVRKYSSS